MIIYEYYIYCGLTVIRCLSLRYNSLCLSALIPMLPLRVVSTVVVNCLFEAVLS